MYTTTKDKITEYKSYFCTYEPETYTDTKRIMDADNSIAREIADMQHYITQLKKHRAKLAKRYNELVIMSYRMRCELRRERRWRDSKVTYHIIYTMVFEDGSEKLFDQNNYSGTERNQAIADFEAIQKAYPSWEFLKNIERKAWEK